jgi:hypothetical protein
MGASVAAGLVVAFNTIYRQVEVAFVSRDETVLNESNLKIESGA